MTDLSPPQIWYRSISQLWEVGGTILETRPWKSIEWSITQPSAIVLKCPGHIWCSPLTSENHRLVLWMLPQNNSAADIRILPKFVMWMRYGFAEAVQWLTFMARGGRKCSIFETLTHLRIAGFRWNLVFGCAMGSHRGSRGLFDFTKIW